MRSLAQKQNQRRSPPVPLGLTSRNLLGIITSIPSSICSARLGIKRCSACCSLMLRGDQPAPQHVVLTFPYMLLSRERYSRSWQSISRETSTSRRQTASLIKSCACGNRACSAVALPVEGAPQVRQCSQVGGHEQVQKPPRIGPGDLDQPAIPLIVHEVLRSPGRPLDTATRSFMEPRLEPRFQEREGTYRSQGGTISAIH